MVDIVRDSLHNRMVGCLSISAHHDKQCLILTYLVRERGESVPILEQVKVTIHGVNLLYLPQDIQHLLIGVKAELGTGIASQVP